MNGTFEPKDVTLLLKDLTGLISPLPTAKRERLIQSGTHYSEMLPLEYVPSPEYVGAFEAALQDFSDITAQAVAEAAEKIYRAKPNKLVLVSLARAGTPAGILIKRYLETKYRLEIPHYSISIIRGRGIDANAMQFILQRHPPEAVQFIDGWTGKGAILKTLRSALDAFPAVSPELAVIADPPQLTELFGTRDDFLIASACLNSIVCGLMSRTVLRGDLIGPNDFHGAVFYNELKPEDRTYQFINAVERRFKYDTAGQNFTPPAKLSGMAEVYQIAEKFKVGDLNFIKPGIGETTRVLLRRIPDVVLIKKDGDSRYLHHLVTLANERRVPITEYPLVNYNACGIIKQLGADV